MFGIPLGDWPWIFLIIAGVATIWACQSWRRQKEKKPKHLPGLLALAGVCYGLAIIFTSSFNMWSWSLPMIVLWVLALAFLAGATYLDVVKSINLNGDGGGGGGHDGHHTLTPLLVGSLGLMVILTIGHGAVNAINSGVNTVQTTSSVTDLLHHHHGHHGKK